MSDATGAGPLDKLGLPIGYPHRPDWEITPRDCAAALRDAARAPLIIDCRTEPERAICRIEGSMHLPLHEFELRLPDLKDDLEDAPRAVVVYCHHGVRSLRAVAILRAAGIDARSLAGGVDLWSIDIDPSVPRY